MNAAPPRSRQDELPHSVEAEQAVLGGLLLEPGRWSEVSSIVSEADFYRPDHVQIFKAMGALAARGVQHDVLLVSQELEARGVLKACGGLAYLGELARDTPTAANLVAHAERVHERARLRRLLALGDEVARAASSGATADQVVAALKPVIDKLAAPRHARRRLPPVDWSALEGREPPARKWIIPHWLPAGHMTLLAGRGGIGKTLIAQHIGAALALGHEYVEPLVQRRVLMWAGEDDASELWRRQVSISSWMGSPLAALEGRLVMHSYAGTDVTLLTPVYGALTATPMLDELRAQVGDYRPDLVILDNVARLYGGSENDRHAVTTFCAIVQGACAPAAVLLLGHPAKSAGSEYSGSTAWEGAVRARLYLSDRPPDQEAEDDAPFDDRVRYLSRRKANYSPLDIRKLNLHDGVLVPEAVDAARVGRPGGEYLHDIVRRAVQALAARDIFGTGSTASPNYLPRLAKRYRLLETATERAFADAMRQMILAGALISREVGRGPDRHKRFGLVTP